MGCINKTTLINVKSIKSFNKEDKINIKPNENEDFSNIALDFSVFTIEDTDELQNIENQSEILNNGRIEDNKLIFI